LVQPALQDEPRRSRGLLGPSLAENRPKNDPEISGQTAFRYRRPRASKEVRHNAPVLAVVKAKIKNKSPRNRAGIGPKPTISLGKWQSGPSPGTPRAKEKIKNNFKHSQLLQGLGFCRDRGDLRQGAQRSAKALGKGFSYSTVVEERKI
jgi:hypothetical protein